MAAESNFVDLAKKVAEKVLAPPLFVERHKSLLYQVTVDNRLKVTVNIKKPSRGSSAFQTDLCILEKLDKSTSIPRVVIEFKTRISTHDVLTYSAKAAKHKQIYPYLRYGLIASDEFFVPGRLFTHNEALDFCATVSGLSDIKLRKFFSDLLRAEVKASRGLESIAFGSVKTRLFRNVPTLKKQ